MDTWASDKTAGSLSIGRSLPNWFNLTLDSILLNIQRKLNMKVRTILFFVNFYHWDFHLVCMRWVNRACAVQFCQKCNQWNVFLWISEILTVEAKMWATKRGSVIFCGKTQTQKATFCKTTVCVFWSTTAVYSGAIQLSRSHQCYILPSAWSLIDMQLQEVQFGGLQFKVGQDM